jgi:Alginate export
MMFTGAMFAQQSLSTARVEVPADNAANASAAQTLPSPSSASAAAPTKHKIGQLEISVNWRTRAEGWNWFEGQTGNSDYGFWNSTLRIGLGQTGERMDWFVEGEQPSILGLPSNAVVAAPQGQLGLGGSYYAANHNHTNEANGFVKQAFVNFKHLGPIELKIGRFEYFDGTEVKPKDPFLTTIVQARIANRLISNFGFSAVQRAFDGVQLSLNSGQNNLTFLGARPTQGVFQVKGMSELDVDVYAGTYTRVINSGRNAASLRIFGIGYIDHRTLVLKTDNRPSAIRSADQGKIEIATYGVDYVHVYDADKAGRFDLVLWGALQNGSWGSQTQHAAAFVTEAGWQLPVKVVQPWFSVGYSYGSGDGDANNSRHSTFFQLLPTPRTYARFPFYNMMNNEDAYGTLNLRPTSKLSLRTEAHALRLASASDLWYSGGGAFQPKTFGYTGRPSNGNRGVANVWDFNVDYQFARSFSTTFYYGHAWGKGVIATIYPKDANGQFVFLETNFHF